MQKLWIRSAPEGWAEGLKLLKDDLSFTLDPAGLPPYRIGLRWADRPF
mgnify:CR=1 FL=1